MQRKNLLRLILLMVRGFCFTLNACPEANKVITHWEFLCTKCHDGAFLEQQFKVALNQQSPDLLDKTLSLSLNHYHRQAELVSQELDHKTQLKLNSALSDQLTKLFNARTTLQQTLNQWLNLQAKSKISLNFQKSWGQMSTQSLCVGFNHLFATCQLWHPLSYLTLGLCLTSAGLALLFRHKQTQAKQKGLLAQQIYNLELLAPKLNILFNIHEQALESFEQLLEDIQSTTKILQAILFNAPKNRPSSAQIQTTLQQILQFLVQQSLALNQNIKAQKMSIIGHIAIMRHLKPCNESFSELIAIFCSPEMLLKLEPMRIQNILQNSAFLASQLGCLIHLDTIKNPAPRQNANIYDLAWLEDAKIITQTYKLFFQQQKPDYYNTVLRNLIAQFKLKLRY